MNNRNPVPVVRGVASISVAKQSTSPAWRWYEVWGTFHQDRSGLFLRKDIFHGTAANASPYKGILRFYRSPHHYYDYTFPFNGTSSDYCHNHRYVLDACRIRHTETLLEDTRRRMLHASTANWIMLNRLAIYFDQQVKNLKRILPIQGLQGDIFLTCEKIKLVIKTWPRQLVSRWNESLDPLLDLTIESTHTIDMLIDLYTYAPVNSGIYRHHRHVTELIELIQKDRDERHRMDLASRKSRAKLKIQHGVQNFSVRKLSKIQYSLQITEKHLHQSKNSVHRRLANLVDHEEPSLWPQFSIFYMLEPFNGLNLSIVRGLKDFTKSVAHPVRSDKTISKHERTYRIALWAQFRIHFARYAVLRQEIADLAKWYYAIAVLRVTTTEQASCPKLIEASREIVQKREVDRITRDHLSVRRMQREADRERRKRQIRTRRPGLNEDRERLAQFTLVDSTDQALVIDPPSMEHEREDWSPGYPEPSILGYKRSSLIDVPVPREIQVRLIPSMKKTGLVRKLLYKEDPACS